MGVISISTHSPFLPELCNPTAHGNTKPHVGASMPLLRWFRSERGSIHLLAKLNHWMEWRIASARQRRHLSLSCSFSSPWSSPLVLASTANVRYISPRSVHISGALENSLVNFKLSLMSIELSIVNTTRPSASNTVSASGRSGNWRGTLMLVWSMPDGIIMLILGCIGLLSCCFW